MHMQQESQRLSILLREEQKTMLASITLLGSSPSMRKFFPKSWKYPSSLIMRPAY